MATSKAQLMAVKKYRQEKRDQISFDVPKGKRDELKQSASLLGMSLRGLFVSSVEEYISRHAGETFADKQQTRKSLSPAEEKLLGEFSKLPPDAQKSLMKFLQTINRQGDEQ